MTITIKANNKITDARIIKYTDGSGDVYAVEIDFDQSYLYSDLEFWLDNDNGEYKDHMCLNVSKREKMQTHK